MFIVIMSVIPHDQVLQLDYRVIKAYPLKTILSTLLSTRRVRGQYGLHQKSEGDLAVLSERNGYNRSYRKTKDRNSWWAVRPITRIRWELFASLNTRVVNHFGGGPRRLAVLAAPVPGVYCNSGGCLWSVPL